MTTTHGGSMFSGSTQAETPRTYPHFERRFSHANDQGHAYTYSRPPIELPRPLEPRPSLHTSLSESSSTHRRHEPYRVPPTTQPEYRHQGQSLPGLRDILTSAPPVSTNPPYSTPWTSNADPKINHQSSDGYYGHMRGSLHPPLALHPPTDHSSRYQNAEARAFELPILETSPVPRHAPQALPLSPYAGYTDSAREFANLRPERGSQPPAAPYVANGAQGPYTPPAHEEAHFRSSTNAYDRTPTSGLGGPSSAQNQKKYLGVRDVPGEGTFHVYENGDRLPTHVDGEQVNPAWGLTKANKPRKRLALACLDCREKKIKCEPGLSSCIQCEKAKRPCRRAPPQPTQNETTPSAWTSGADSPVRKGASASDPTPRSTHDPELDPLNKRRTREDPSPPNVPHKKHRSTSPRATVDQNTVPLAEHAGPARQVMSIATPSPPKASRNTVQSWDEDPYNVDPSTTLRLLGLYFTHINSDTYCIFPRNHIFNWVKTESGKCLNERMTLYAMLAVASVFVDREDGHLFGFGRNCVQIASDAISSQVGRISLCLTQSRLLMALYHYSQGEGSYAKAWDLSGSAIRAATYMRLQTEDGCLDDTESKKLPRNEFSFTKGQLEECKRRTFWSTFLMDRLLGSAQCLIKPQDVFLRLPMMDEQYESGAPSNVPFYENELVDPTQSILTANSGIAPMGWLVSIAGIWGDVLDFLHRAHYRPKEAYREAYELFDSQVSLRLQGWSTRLPEDLQYSESDLDKSIQHGYVGTFLSMHALHHFSLMKLHRYIRHALVPDQISRSIREANNQAHEMLRMASAVVQVRREITMPMDHQPSIFSLSSPFLGAAIVLAVDIASAGGIDNFGATLRGIEDGVVCLTELGPYWNFAKDQAKACYMRLLALNNLATPRGSRAGCWLGRKWGMVLPLDDKFIAEEDCIYGLGDDKKGNDNYYGGVQGGNAESTAPAGSLRLAGAA